MPPTVSTILHAQTFRRLLVVGSGDSALSAQLASEKALKPEWEVISIDFSSEVTDRMKIRFPELAFLTMDARALSFEDASFGAIVDKGLSDCIGSVTERRKYFQELRRVAVDGGRLLVLSQRHLQTEQDILDQTDEDGSDLGPSWLCKREEVYGALFVENDPTRPPFPQPGTDNTIPYFLLVCTTNEDTAEQSMT
ncbi:unnamed protein product [Durusdinium trenchii]|uniref:Methyltransferase type 11 domain-containing protein n=1 Tax=Durusdinium trenchii TaxID=1381693 RepID=A0ABP0KNU3_9DINO